jgi:hypothetical protein
MASDPAVRRALRTGDAQGLLAVWGPIFEAWKQDYHITHLKFMNAARVCILRVDDPASRGDRDDGVTDLEAARTGKVASGLEVGPTGESYGEIGFTLNVVEPIFEGRQLLGYVEFSREIEDALRARQDHAGLDLALTL